MRFPAIMIRLLMPCTCPLFPGCLATNVLSHPLFQRVKELREEARGESPSFDGKVDPVLVADKFLERPRMEQRFFGFRFDDLNAEGLSLDLKTLNKVFTTLETVQGLELKTE